MPDEENDQYKSGVKAFRNNKYNEAIVHFSQAIQQKSDIHKAFNALGVSYSKIGNNTDAERCFEKALILDPHNPTYEKNLRQVSQKKNPLTNQAISSQGSPSDPNKWKSLLVIGISLIALTGIIFFLIFSSITLQSGTNLFSDGFNEGGLFQSLLHPLVTEERIYPTASVTVQNKRIEYKFDRDQDLSQINRIEARVSISDGTEVNFPVVMNPQKNLYYGMDDPFFRKEKRFVMTGFFQDNVSAVLVDTDLDPR